MNDTKSYEEQLESLVDIAMTDRWLRNDRHTLEIKNDEIRVRVIAEHGPFVAFSSMRGDFEPSLREFIEDYFL